MGFPHRTNPFLVYCTTGDRSKQLVVENQTVVVRILFNASGFEKSTIANATEFNKDAQNNNCPVVLITATSDLFGEELSSGLRSVAGKVPILFAFYSILFYSILFYSILFYSIRLLFYSILFYSPSILSILHSSTKRQKHFYPEEEQTSTAFLRKMGRRGKWRAKDKRERRESIAYLFRLPTQWYGYLIHSLIHLFLHPFILL